MNRKMKKKMSKLCDGELEEIDDVLVEVIENAIL